MSNMKWPNHSCKKYLNLGTRFPENFSTLPENFSIKIFSQKEKMIVSQFLRKREKFIHSSILLIIIPAKMEGLANINMSKDS